MNTLTKEKPACCHCGSSKNVVTTLEHVGGKGDVPVTQCRNRIRCWERWDRQHGFQIKSEYLESVKEQREMQARVHETEVYSQT